MNEQREIDNGFKGTCKKCGRVLKVRVPRARFFPGDGTVRVMFAHKQGKERCPGSGRPAREWDL